MPKKAIDWPVVMVIVLLVFMLAFGAVALVAENKPDPVLFNDRENQLDNAAWMALYEEKKAARKLEQQQGLLHWFMLPRAGEDQ